MGEDCFGLGDCCFDLVLGGIVVLVLGEDFVFGGVGGLLFCFSFGGIVVLVFTGPRSRVVMDVHWNILGSLLLKVLC